MLNLKKSGELDHEKFENAKFSIRGELNEAEERIYLKN
jgi:hypothetical protein